MDGDEDCSIRVICRFRPVNKREIEEGGGLAKQLTFPTDKCVEVASFNGRGPQTFNFDKIFYDPTTTQKDIYELAARKSIDDVIKGYNSTIFAYGQTGAGKSFTMFGVISVPDLKGIIPRSCMHIFDHIAKDTSGTEYTIKCSFLEIYKEIVRDLLNPSGSAGKQGLKVRESPGKGVWVEGLHEAYVSCEQDVFDLIQTGEGHRAVSSTSMNASSSRSHSLFILTLHQKTRDGSTKEGRLNLADLAGSEKVGKTGATGDTLEEAKKINQSLSALGNCINALTKAKKTHVPYRDSKLTFILRESLGGNCKTTLLVACSPHIFNLEETISTLMFAKRAKTIKNSVKLNAQRSVAELMAIIEKLKKELTYFKKYIDILEKELAKVKGPNWKDDLPKISAASTEKEVTKEDEDDKFDDDDAATQSQPDLSKSDSVNADEDESDSEEEAKTENGALPSGEESGSVIGSPKKEKKVKKPKKIKKNEEEDEEIYRSSTNMSVKLAELEVELQRIKEKSECEIRDLTEENKSLTEQNNQLENKIQDKKNKLNEKELEVKKMKESLEDEKRNKEILEEKLTYEIQQLSLKNEEQENKINSVDSYNIQMKEKITSIEIELEKNQSEFEIMQREKQKLTKENEEMNTKIHQQLQKIQEIQLKLSEIEQNNVNMKSEIQQKENANKNLQQKIENLEIHLKNQENQTNEIQSKLRVSATENMNLQAQINDLTFEIENLQTQIKEFQHQNALEVQEKVKEIENISIPIAQFEAVLKEKENFVNSFHQIQEKYKTERDFVIQLQNQIEELNFTHENEKNHLKSSFEKEREDFSEKLNFLQAKLDENQEIYLNKLKNLEEKSLNYSIDLEYEKSSRLVAEEKLEKELQESSIKNKDLRRLKAQLEDKDREITQQQSLFTSQTRSLDAQASRIKQLETELEDTRRDREILQQEIKTAIEINIENARKFEQQLETTTKDITTPGNIVGRAGANSNIRVPIAAKAEPGFFEKLFGIKQLPYLAEVKPQLKAGYLLVKGSSWFNRWRKRWFVLSDKQRMFYFESNTQTDRADDFIFLKDAAVYQGTESNGKNTIKLLFNQKRSEIFLQARNEEELVEWTNLLLSQIKVSNASTPKRSTSNALSRQQSLSVANINLAAYSEPQTQKKN